MCVCLRVYVYSISRNIIFHYFEILIKYVRICWEIGKDSVVIGAKFFFLLLVVHFPKVCAVHTTVDVVAIIYSIPHYIYKYVSCAIYIRTI